MKGKQYRHPLALSDLVRVELDLVCWPLLTLLTLPCRLVCLMSVPSALSRLSVHEADDVDVGAAEVEWQHLSE